ncbi:MAG: hypothetical protein AAF926_05660, partial [Pseudomonadota bacterium]
MKRVFRSWTGCVVGLTLASSVLSACKTVSPTREEPSTSAETTRSPAEQLEHFIAIFPGRYDSWQQWRDTVGSETRNY